MKKTAVLFLIIMMTLLCFGCADHKPGRVSAAIVGGPMMNAPEYPLNAPTLERYLEEVCLSYGKVSFIRADGNPQIFFQTTIPKPSIEGLSKEKLSLRAKNYVQELQDIYSKDASALYEETDPLEAIDQARNAIVNEEGEKIILLMHSGLGTCGYLKWQDGLLHIKAEAIVKALKERQALPDLNGISVYWLFFGKTAPPQTELSKEDLANLREVWTAIIEAAGGKLVFADDPVKNSAPENLPGVTVVKTGEKELGMNYAENTRNRPMETIVLRDTELRFYGDSTKLIEEDKARNSLRTVAEQLLRVPERTVYVIGTTASGRKDFCKKLSEGRASRVVRILQEYGVDSTKMITAGLDYENPWHVEDRDAKGNFIESLARENRTVRIIDQNSEDAGLLEPYLG